MKRPVAATRIGMGWYRREDWDRLLQMFPDRDELHDTYDEWLADVQRNEKFLKREGHIVRRIIVDPDKLAVWCVIRGVEPVAGVRAEYVCEQMRPVSNPAEKG